MTSRYPPSTSMPSLQAKPPISVGEFTSVASQAVKESASKKASAQAALNIHLFSPNNIDMTASMHRST